VPKMVRGKCALHEKRVRVQFFSMQGGKTEARELPVKNRIDPLRLI